MEPPATLAPRIVVTTDPENSEFPFADLRSWLTPEPQFYVRSHFPVPAAARSWSVSVGGKRLALAELAALPQRNVVATLECAGNNRAYLDPPAAGVPWRLGAVSNGEWSGPSLADVLAAAGAREAAHVHLTGADRGDFQGREIAFARSVPRDKALHPDTIVALRLNGAPLTPPHGAPARAVVPGWYGMASVKWLAAIDPRDEPSDNPFMVDDYTRRTPDGGKEPLEWMEPKAQIARPAEHAVVPAGEVLVEGAAWSGRAPVARVELSADGGATWHAAALDDPESRWAWRRWRWTWRAAPGRHALMARAVDAEGNTQPAVPDHSSPGYVNHWVRPHPVEVA
jgi:DMSO/TMAO reductase YedYZ molybdopterin-dependent catalytic subunit